MQLPKQTVQKQNESESYAIVLYYLRKIGIFRNVTENDYGIDFEIELVVKGSVTGRYLKAQVKSSDNLYIRKGDGVPTVGGIKQSTLRYWTEISRHTNVILFAVDLTTEQIFVSDPLFWQCAALLDGTETSKTIECIPMTGIKVSDANKLIVPLVLRAFLEPTTREQISVHSSVLRRLKDFIQLYSDVFHYDGHVPINDHECFREFLELSALLLGKRKVKEKFKVEDQAAWSSYEYWKSKTECDGPYNFDCYEPMKIILPLLLDELESLRSKVLLKCGYYWIHTDPEYFQLVAKYLIPTDRDHDAFYKMPDHEDLFDLENSDYRVYQLVEVARKPAN
jgi:hypothetical protein